MAAESETSVTKDLVIGQVANRKAQRLDRVAEHGDEQMAASRDVRSNWHRTRH